MKEPKNENNAPDGSVESSDLLGLWGNEPFELAMWHDVILELLLAKGLPAESELLKNEGLSRLYAMLPESIQSTAKEWGLRDTVFRDLAYEWLLENWPNAKGEARPHEQPKRKNNE